ncbi:hypothetical protein ABPG74_011431 [Tetrahymena malaccensis]
MDKFIFTESDQYVLNSVYTQQQVTKISQGLFIQQQSQFSGPIYYNYQNNIFSNQFNQPYIQVQLQMDQMVQEISIQFPTIPEILALANSTFALLLTLGFFFKILSQNEIIQGFFWVFLENLYQETYQKLLQDNKLLEYKSKSKSQVQQINDDGQFAGQDFLEKDTSDNIYMPQFASKFRYYLEQSPQYQQNNFEFKIEQDQIIETKELNNESQIQNKSIETQLYKKAQQKNQYTLNNTQISRSNDSKLNENINVSQSNQIILKSNSIKQNQIRQDKNLESISQKLRAIKDLNIFQKVKGAIFEKRWFCKKKKKESLDEKKQGFETFKVLIEQQINKQINIFDFYKDLLFIKKSVMILLSKEQLAAMQLVGYSTQYLADQSSQLKDIKQSDQMNKNYIEKQQNILNSCDLQCKYIKKFFSKQKNENNNKVDINSRILSSIRI